VVTERRFLSTAASFAAIPPARRRAPCASAHDTSPRVHGSDERHAKAGTPAPAWRRGQPAATGDPFVPAIARGLWGSASRPWPGRVASADGSI